MTCLFCPDENAKRAYHGHIQCMRASACCSVVDDDPGAPFSNASATACVSPRPSAPAISPGDVIVRIDPSYFRPAEVETLLGDPTKAREKLGWVPEITAREMCAEMVAEDLKTARRHALLKEHGLELPVSLENG